MLRNLVCAHARETGKSGCESPAMPVTVICKTRTIGHAAYRLIFSGV